jgi:hypothetical protein
MRSHASRAVYEGGTLLCCEVQYRFYETRRARDDFFNDELARFCHELLGEQVRVTAKSRRQFSELRHPNNVAAGGARARNNGVRRCSRRD